MGLRGPPGASGGLPGPPGASGAFGGLFVVWTLGLVVGFASCFSALSLPGSL